jgi:toxin-antitoxin system PIN domain toxin
LIALDTNLLLYAYSAHSPQHRSAAQYLNRILSGKESVGIPLPVIHSFVRLLANPAVTGHAVNLKDALDTVDTWLAQPQVHILYPGERHWQLLKEIAITGNAPGNLFPDAAIAAIAMEYGAVLHTNDRDFARFPGLRWHNPLQS